MVTHGHADHLGFAAVLGARRVPVFVPDADVGKARTTAVRTPPRRLKNRLRRAQGVGEPHRDERSAPGRAALGARA